MVRAIISLAYIIGVSSSIINDLHFIWFYRVSSIFIINSRYSMVNNHVIIFTFIAWDLSINQEVNSIIS